MEKSLTTSQLFTEIAATLTKLFGIAAEKITLEAELAKDLDLDSIDFVDLLSTASDRFNLDLSPYDFEGVKTLGEFIMRLESLVAKQDKLNSKTV